MILSGVGNAQVFRTLKAQAEVNGDEAQFTIMDVYHACGSSTGERRLDATNLVEMLRQREMEEGLFQRTTTDQSGCMDKVFFVMKGATEIYANEPEQQVVEIDHKVCMHAAACAARAAAAYSAHKHTFLRCACPHARRRMRGPHLARLLTRCAVVFSTAPTSTGSR
jgi:hypothetical protein